MATYANVQRPAPIDPEALKARPGKPAALGATVDGAGVNFAIYSQHATRAWLCLFNEPGDTSPAFEVELDPGAYRFGDVWCVRVDGLSTGCIYAWRFDGPSAPKQGDRFDASKYLLDPYATAIVHNTLACHPRPLVEEPEVVERSGSPRVPLNQTVIYEVHVKGFTAHASASVEHAGTYQGVVEKIPYLQDLGVTAVELLPIHECGEGLTGHKNPRTGEALTNYWGYNTIGFFAPAGRYASAGKLGAQTAEFRAMVAELHNAGIEVILDVVYNHTAEGNHKGPTMAFRGIDNRSYYILESDGKYTNYSGCGNTFKCNGAVGANLIMDSLRYWVTEMGVDGFRFDLATILNRDPTGKLLDHSPLLQRMSEDPVLRGVKLISEAWDVGGGYQVGRFGDDRWADWNDRFRDDVRRFWRGDPGTKSDFALRITGSPDVYQQHGRTPLNSINFVTAHDGFTLRDLVSYNDKHNQDNGEENKDGSNHNLSWNCGIEGVTDNAEVNELRCRMQKSMLATLFVSLGVPMLLGGDEFGRTQRGNNNAFCQDNEISWFDWSLLEKNAGLFRFCKNLIAFRKANPVFARDHFFDGKAVDDKGTPDIAWYDALGGEQRWTSADHTLTCAIHPSCNGGRSLYMMFNPTLVAREFRVPKGDWRVCMNTANASPDDIMEGESGPVVSHPNSFVLGRKALAVLCRQDG